MESARRGCRDGQKKGSSSWPRLADAVRVAQELPTRQRQSAVFQNTSDAGMVLAPCQHGDKTKGDRKANETLQILFPTRGQHGESLKKTCSRPYSQCRSTNRKK